MNKYFSKKFIIFYIFVVLLAAALLVLYLNPKILNAPTGETEKNKNNTQQPANKEAAAPANNVSQVLSYAEALKIYVNKRIQFDENCLVIPNYLTFKRGTKIMLDNRASVSRPVYLDRQVYNISAYGFKIVTLNTTFQLPHEIMIDCGSGRNNGRILLQQ